MNETSLRAVEAELRARSPELYLSFRRTWPRLRPHLSEEALWAWGQGVLALATASPDGAASALMSASLPAAALLSLEGFGQWQAVGLALAAVRPQETTGFFQTSPQALEGLAPGAREPFLALCLKAASRDPNHFLAWFDQILAVLGAVPAAGQRSFLRLAEAFAEAGDDGGGDSASPSQMAAILDRLPPEHRPTVLGMAEGLIRSSIPGALIFLRSAPELLKQTDPRSLETWWSEGERLLRHDEEEGLRFFRREALGSQELLDSLTPAMELKTVREVLMLYNQALTGAQLRVLPATELAKLDIGWSRVEQATTEGSAIFCPERVQRFPTKDQNFEVYKVLVAHQAGHLERGSFRFDFQRPSGRFSDLRPILAQARPPRVTEAIAQARFFDLFTIRSLATDVFTVVEDARVDAQLIADYRGLRHAYGRVQTQALEGRSPLGDLPLQEACLEALLRFSAGGPSRYRFPEFLLKTLSEAAGLIRLVQAPDASIEDTAEASLRLYLLLCLVPNWLPWPEPLVEVDLSEASYNPDDEDIEALAVHFLEVDREPAGVTHPTPGLPEERPYRRLPQLDPRGEFKPELVQTLTQLREELANPGTRADISTAELKDLLLQSVEVESPASTRIDPDGVAELVGANLLRELGKDWDQGHPAHRPPRRRRVWRPDADALLQGEAIPFTYDEWDFRRRTYRPDWCTLWQRPIETGAIDFYEETLSEHKAQLSEVRRQFELLKPSRQRRQKRLPDGEEFDLDAVIEALVDRRAGRANAEKIYWRRDKAERDVSVAILLDMSVSTMELIEDAGDAKAGKRPKRIIDLEKESLVLLTQALELVKDNYGIYGFSGLGRQNVQFFVIKDLKERFSDRVKRRIDRVIPVQGTRMAPAIRHATAKLEEVDSKTKLLILISDGRPQDQDYGRDPAEAVQMWGRGPTPGTPPLPTRVRDAVRFEEILMRREKEYAVHDTRRALLEARQRDIIPFCISVDRRGHDYLRAMCGDMGYEVVSDIASLPQRLTALYRRLTT